LSEFAALLTFVIPASLGAAWSPLILVTATDLSRGESASRVRALAFWLGGVLALLFWAVVLASALWGWFQSTARDLERDVPLLETVLGVVLIVVGLAALLQWHRIVATFEQARRHHSQEDRRQHDGLLKLTAAGAVIQGRDVSSMVLYIAIVGRIGSADASIAAKLGTLALSIGIITAAFWIPIVTPITIPRRVRGWFTPVGRWIDRHARAITVSVAWSMAVLLLTHGHLLENLLNATRSTR
jgi:threonine/homoserine/homoserine lactone efflux protein